MWALWKRIGSAVHVPRAPPPRPGLFAHLSPLVRTAPTNSVVRARSHASLSKKREWGTDGWRAAEEHRKIRIDRVKKTYCGLFPEGARKGHSGFAEWSRDWHSRQRVLRLSSLGRSLYFFMRELPGPGRVGRHEGTETHSWKKFRRRQSRGEGTEREKWEGALGALNKWKRNNGQVTIEGEHGVPDDGLHE